MWNPLDQFEIRYREAQIWFSTNKGMPHTSNKASDMEKSVALFCDKQRRYKKDGTLSDDKIKKMEALRSNWYWKIGDRFDDNYNKIIAWIKDNENTKPSEYSDDPHEKRLGQWLNSEKVKNKKKINAYKNEKLNIIDSLINTKK